MIVALVLLAALSLPAHAAVFKWVDINGSVQYSDTPPPPGARKVEETKLVPSSIDTEGIPFSIQEAAKRNPVTLWVSDCGELCTRARDYLAKRGVPHTMRNPLREGEQEAWKGGERRRSQVSLACDWDRAHAGGIQ